MLELAHWHKERFHQYYPKDETNNKPILEFVQYHYVINGCGNRFETRPDNKVGWHCANYNEDSIGIALCGNFEKSTPTMNQINELYSLLLELLNRHNLSPCDVVCHRTLTNTLCPGKNLVEAMPGLLDRIRTKIIRSKEIKENTMKEHWYYKLWSKILGLLKLLKWN